MNKKKYMKVVEWENPCMKHNSDTGYSRLFTDKDYLVDGIVFMIPIIGQLCWIYQFFRCRSHRKVYFEEVK